tara:strand:+ start:934 stop:3372 length:2439 start_codon:yes stop_codon:yes gene_type:complete
MTLEEQQLSLEEGMVNYGIEKYRKQVREAQQKGTESTSLHGIMLMKHSVDAVEKKLNKYLSEALSGGVGKKHHVASYLVQLDADVASYISLKLTIDGISFKQQFTALAGRIGQAIEDQVKFNIWQDHDRKTFRYLKEKLSKQTASRHFKRYGLIRQCRSNIEVENLSFWTVKERIHVGSKLLDIVLLATGLIRIQVMTHGTKKRELQVLPTSKTLDWIQGVNIKGEVLCPAYKPMLVPPKDWVDFNSGGYLTKRVPFIKVRNQVVMEDLQKLNYDIEYQCVNSIQKTKWKINKPVYETQLEAWQNHVELGSIPGRNSIDIPPAPVPPDLKKKDMDKETFEKFIRWKITASEIYQENVRRTSKILQFLRTIKIAEEYLKHDQFYFPHNADFRGRKYTLPAFLTPQGPEYSKSLLTFAEGKPIETQEQEDWLAIHGANCAGVDKVSFYDRIKFVRDNNDAIIQSAQNGLNCEFWQKMDDPWLFYAFCHEWAEYKRHGKGYLSCLPVALDGSNNGLQHYSAMLRCPIGGKATNLTSEDIPQDIYQDVADYTLDQVKMLASQNDEMAKQWLDTSFINRKMTKRPVMVVPYGGTLFSCRNYIEDYVRDMFYKGHRNPWEGQQLHVPINWISTIVWDSINHIVVSAREAMTWIRDIAREMSKRNIPLIWKTPTDFVVYQQYPNMKKHRIKTTIDGNLIRPTLNTEENKSVDRNRAVNGSAPNFVHALDASALTNTVYMCNNDGIDAYCMIHDSYGTHASNTPILAKRLREAFVNLYKQYDVLEDFRQSALEVLDEVPDPPKKGDLDLDQIMESKYFFA